jgi:AcrR family transcriptional regulator
MPKVTEEHRAARRHEIASAALRCFARAGFQQTSMADIIAESGLSAGAIYGHYKNKEELVELAVSEVLDARFLDVAEAKISDPVLSPAAVVRRILDGLTEQLGELQLLIQVWGQVPINPRLGEMASRIGNRVLDTLTGYLSEWYEKRLLMSPSDAEARARADAPLYVGIVQGFVTQSVLFGEFDREGYLEAVERFVSLPATRPE